MRNKYPNFPIVVVEWRDAIHSAGQWESIEDQTDELPLIYSAGFLVKKTRSKIIVCAAVDPASGHMAGEITIPRSMVQSIKILKDRIR